MCAEDEGYVCQFVFNVKGNKAVGFNHSVHNFVFFDGFMCRR